jgi:hypothetical protein
LAKILEALDFEALRLNNPLELGDPAQPGGASPIGGLLAGRSPPTVPGLELLSHVAPRR